MGYGEHWNSFTFAISEIRKYCCGGLGHAFESGSCHPSEKRFHISVCRLDSDSWDQSKMACSIRSRYLRERAYRTQRLSEKTHIYGWNLELPWPMCFASNISIACGYITWIFSKWMHSSTVFYLYNGLFIIFIIFIFIIFIFIFVFF